MYPRYNTVAKKRPFFLRGQKKEKNFINKKNNNKFNQLKILVDNT